MICHCETFLTKMTQLCNLTNTAIHQHKIIRYSLEQPNKSQSLCIYLTKNWDFCIARFCVSENVNKIDMFSASQSSHVSEENRGINVFQLQFGVFVLNDDPGLCCINITQRAFKKYMFSGLCSRCPESQSCVSIPGKPGKTPHFLGKISLKGGWEIVKERLV